MSFFALSASVAIAQPANQFFLESLPQSFYLNPGKKQQATFHMDFLLPMNIGVVNNGFNFSDLMTGNEIIPANILPSLKDNNYLSIAFTKHLLNFGFKVKEKNYFSYNASVKFAADVNFSKDFFTAVIEGPGADQFINGDAINFDGTRFNVLGYIEHGFGYSREVNEKLIVGGRLKYLQGVINFNGNFDGISVETATDLTSLTVNSSLAVKSSVPDSAAQANNQFIGGNNGIAIDLGGSYIVNNEITAYASITDLGMINWGSANSKTLTNNGASFKFEGLQVSDLGDTAATNGLTDSITDIFKLEETPGAYTVNLPTRFFIGGTYQFNKNWCADVLYSGRIVNGQYLSSAVIGGGVKANKWFEGKLSYTVASNTYTNIGFAAVLNLGAWQLYFVTDNILGLAQIDYAKNVNASLGMNFTFGRKKFFEKTADKATGDKKSSVKKDKTSSPTDSSSVPVIDEVPTIDELPTEESIETPVIEEVIEDATDEVIEKAAEEATEKVAPQAITPQDEFEEIMKDTLSQEVDSLVTPVAEILDSTMKNAGVVDTTVAPATIVEEALDSTIVPAAEELIDTTITPVVEEAIDSTVTPVKDSMEASPTAPSSEEPSTEIKSNNDAEGLNKVLEEIKQSGEEKAKELPADIK